MDPLRIADTVIRQGHGVATYAELLRAQVTPSQVRRLTVTGHLVRLHQGVYALSGWPASPEHSARAAQAAGSARAAADGVTALRVRGIDVVRYRADEELPDEICDPTVTRRRFRDRLIVHPGPMPVVHVRMDLRAVAPVAALLRPLHGSDRLRAVWAMEDALRKRLVTREQLASLRDGLPRSRQAWVDAVDARSESPLETWARLHAADAGIELEPQIPVGGYRIDLGIRAALLGVEADGKAAHPWDYEPAAADRTRERWLRGAGWDLIRIRWADMISRPGWVIQEIRRTAARRTRSL